MKKLKTKALTGYSTVLSIFMALLGFSTACSLIGGNMDPKVEYGCPSATFVVKGKITSAENSQAIPNIRIIMSVDSYNADTVFTDIEGKYAVSITEFPTDQSFTVKYDDTDGAANGKYAAKTSSVGFENPTFIGGSGWYAGETQTVLDVTLTPEDGSK